MQSGRRAGDELVVSHSSVRHDMALHAARAIATTHCTSVEISRGDGGDAGRGAALSARSETLSALELKLRPEEEIALVCVTFYDPPGPKDDERAIGLANIRVGL